MRMHLCILSELWPCGAALQRWHTCFSCWAARVLYSWRRAINNMERRSSGQILTARGWGVASYEVGSTSC